MSTCPQWAKVIYGLATQPNKMRNFKTTRMHYAMKGNHGYNRGYVRCIKKALAPVAPPPAARTPRKYI
jgi:hypothetical protein